MASIRHNVSRDALPEFRNLGVIARVLVAGNLLAFGAALASAPSWAQVIARFVHDAARIEPVLLGTLVVLYLLSPLTERASYWSGCAIVLCVVLANTAATYALLEERTAWNWSALSRAAALGVFAATMLLGYFRLFVKAHSPALVEARLQALQARIRPHFLFNSLNAVLSLIRRDPRRAEQALEDLSDLFRASMADAGRFTRLADEIALLERYANIEQLRLGERLRISWELDAAPTDALLPPLILQPLLENAIYHGVEPGTGVGDVVVRIGFRGDQVHANIENSYHEAHQHRVGNRIALENIRERLTLFFDAEASLITRINGARYCVDVTMPYRIGAVNTGARFDQQSSDLPREADRE